MNTTANILLLADIYGTHAGLSHWRVAFLLRGDGTFLKKLRDGATCTLKTAESVLAWFSANWPADLEWPAGIARPLAQKREAA